MPAPLDPYIPNPDVRERHEITVRAPADLVLDVARDFDMRSVPLVHAIFRLRERLLGSRAPVVERPRGLVAETTSLGWGRLADEPGRCYVAGAVCQPWLADVVFSPLPPEGFAAYAEPERVKIAWTLEVEPQGPTLTRFASETRVVATDEVARAKFKQYWRWAGFGIVLIRVLLLPAVRRQAEARWRRERPGE